MKKILFVVLLSTISAGFTQASNPEDKSPIPISNSCNGVLTFTFKVGSLKRNIKVGGGQAEIINIEPYRFSKSIENNLNSENLNDVKRAAKALAYLPGGAKSVALFRLAFKDKDARFMAINSFRSWINTSDATADEVLELLPLIMDEDFHLSYDYTFLVHQISVVMERSRAEGFRSFAEVSSFSHNRHMAQFFIDVLRNMSAYSLATLTSFLYALNSDTLFLWEMGKIKNFTSFDSQVWLENLYVKLNLSGVSTHTDPARVIMPYKASSKISLTTYRRDARALNPFIKRAVIQHLSDNLDSEQNVQVLAEILRDPNVNIQETAISNFHRLSNRGFFALAEEFLSDKNAELLVAPKFQDLIREMAYETYSRLRELYSHRHTRVSDQPLKWALSQPRIKKMIFTLSAIDISPEAQSLMDAVNQALIIAIRPQSRS